jgi:hypothetical protein
MAVPISVCTKEELRVVGRLLWSEELRVVSRLSWPEDTKTVDVHARFYALHIETMHYLDGD